MIYHSDVQHFPHNNNYLPDFLHVRSCRKEWSWPIACSLDTSLTLALLPPHNLKQSLHLTTPHKSFQFVTQMTAFSLKAIFFIVAIRYDLRVLLSQHLMAGFKTKQPILISLGFHTRPFFRHFIFFHGGDSPDKIHPTIREASGTV